VNAVDDPSISETNWRARWGAAQLDGEGVRTNQPMRLAAISRKRRPQEHRFDREAAELCPLRIRSKIITTAARSRSCRRAFKDA